MKKLIVLSAMLAAASFGSAGAQSLLDMLNGSSPKKTEAARPAAEKINIDALKGVWMYSGAAVEFTGNDLVSVLGGSVAAPVIKQSLETYYSKVGIVPGSCNINFKSGDIYAARTATSSVEGPYAFDAQSQKVRVTYEHPSVGGRKSMDGRLVFDGEKLTLTFEADKIAAMIKELSDPAKLDQNVKDLMDMIAEYKGLYLGFVLEK